MSNTKNTPTAEILCVGTELLLGDIINTNASFLSSRLAALGVAVYRHTVVGDNPERLKEALTLALSRADIIITSGGLGPTDDDLTKETAAELFGLPLELHKESLESIEDYFKATGRVMTDNNRKQAMMPNGARIFKNRYGTAPSLAIEKDSGEGIKRIIMLPGPPSELVPIFDEEITPYLKSLSDNVIVSRNVNILGMGESAVAEKLKCMLNDGKNPTVAPYCKEGEVRLRVTAMAKSEAEALRMCDECVEEIKRSEVGKFVYGTDAESIEKLLCRELSRKGLTMVSAESCTGGLIAKRMTDIPGSSQVFSGGCVTYTDGIKTELLGVRKQTLDTYTAVSEETAREMARGVRLRLSADIGVATTGFAGPTGGTEKDPVGTVYVALSTVEGEEVRRLSLSPTRSREYIRTVAATNALHMALMYTYGKEKD